MQNFFEKMLLSVAKKYIHVYLTIIPRARMSSESSAEWTIDSEAMSSRGIIICFSKIQLVGQNIETKQL